MPAAEGGATGTTVAVTAVDSHAHVFERGLPLHRELTEAITARDAPRAESVSRALCEMPYLDLASRVDEGEVGPDLAGGGLEGSRS